MKVWQLEKYSSWPEKEDINNINCKTKPIVVITPSNLIFRGINWYQSDDNKTPQQKSWKIEILVDSVFKKFIAIRKNQNQY